MTSDVLADPTTGAIERPLAGSAWAVPGRVDLAGDHLKWSWPGEPRWIQAEGSGRLLERFIGLANAPAPDVLVFARSFGVLAICEHGVPASHHPDAAPASAVRNYSDYAAWPKGCEVRSDDDGRTWHEPVAAWRRFASEAKEIAFHVARMQEGGTAGDPIRPFRDALRVQQTLNEWVDMGRVRPICEVRFGDDVRAAKVVATFGGEGLFGALALRLFLAATGVKGLAICAGCGEVFAPNRKQRPGERSWCETAPCQRAKRAAASADHRYRRRTK